MRISEVKRQARVAEWVQNIRDEQDSGLTVKAWCATQGYGEGRFYYWLKIVRAAAIERAEQAAQGTSLIRVEPERLPTSMSTPCMPTATTNQQMGIHIRHGNATVELPWGTPVAEVAELLKALNTP